jgi:hypothetical protein
MSPRGLRALARRAIGKSFCDLRMSFNFRKRQYSEPITLRLPSIRASIYAGGWSRMTYGLIAICPYINRVSVGVYFFRFHAVKAGAETNVPSRAEGVGAVPRALGQS